MIDLISRRAAIDALAEAMPSLTTPDGCGQFDHDIQVTDEAYVDCMRIIHDLPSAQRWIPCSRELPKNKSYVLTIIYIPGRQAHIRSGWYEDGLFMNDNGDTWKATDKEVVGWMYQPKLPTPYREGGQE